MKCKKCGSEKIVKNGLRRGKPCFLCKNKDCGHQFTNEVEKYNDYDKYIAKKLYEDYIWNKTKNEFIKTELRLTYVARLLNHKYTTVSQWVVTKQKEKNTKELVNYLKKRENGLDILGLLYPDKVHYKPSDKLLEMIKKKN